MKSKALILILACSLALNVFALGFYVGGQFKSGKNETFWQPKERFTQLSDDLKAKIKPVIREEQSKMRENRRQIGQLRKEVRGLLSEEPISRERVEAQFDKIRELSCENIQSAQTILLETIMQADPQARELMLQKMRARPKPPRR